MKQPIEKLYKFLRLEVERGFDDRAVLGGLRNILQSWENEARAAEVPNIIIQAVTARLRDYHQLTPLSREEILRGLWKRVQRSSPEPVPDLFSEPLASPRSRQEAARRTREVKPAKPVQQQPDAPRPEQETPPPPPEVAAEPPVEAESGETHAEAPPDDQEAPETPRSSRRPRKYTVAPVLSPEEAAALGAPLTVISGIGPKTAERLKELGIHTLGDALYYFPRRYDDYSRLEPINRLQYGQTVTVIGSVKEARVRPIRSGMKIVEALITDGTGVIRASWFNQPWLADQLKKAENVSLSGKTDQYLGRMVMNSPEWEALDDRNLHTRRIVPVYPLTGSISQKWLRGKIKEVVDFWADRVQDPLSEEILEDAELMPLSTALKQIHYPDQQETLEDARYRLAFDEIFLLQLSVFIQRRFWTDRNGTVFDPPAEWLQAQLEKLPYALTGAQQRSVEDIRADLSSGRPMNRLLQGDVGSGKTVVAAMAVAMVASGNGQTALMAPTSILAEQHYRGLQDVLAAAEGAFRPEEIAMLIGATPESEKQRIREGLASGDIRLVIGTHALLEPDVIFQNLELVVIDEQHRFGVRQRSILRDKGAHPHLLVMTATPIPRSLALTLYGDLDLTVIDEMPPGRQEVGTYVLRPIERERAYTLIKKEVNKGRQAFMIYPLVEESENSDAKAAVEEHARLQQEVFHNLEIGLLHGRMTPDEKDAVMTRFRDGEIHVLVSTSVVEVGVDVPNATVMVIEGANRFGLAQLHQFRGRVGRGSEKSYCLLVPDQDDAFENERLQAMTETNDGFILAERDLQQRGPGEFLGTRQSGYNHLKLANITDVRLIEKSRRIAEYVFARDPELDEPAHALLKEQIGQIWRESEGDVS